jgi:putative hydrolase of the HAD superfamily
MLYVLDLDDTLYLEKDFVCSGFKAVDRWLSENTPIRNFYPSAWTLFEAGSRNNIFELVLEQRGYTNDPDLIGRLVNIYRRHTPRITLQPDAEAFLGRIEKKKLALITDGYSETQWNKIMALKLNQYIGKIIVTGDWGTDYWKPHPRGFIEISNGYDKAACVYIGDNPQKDFISPRHLGWAPSVRLRRVGSLHYEKPTPPHCQEIHSLNCL